MSEFDSKALASAREVLALTRQEHIGGDAQLIAKIQLLFVDAMEYAAPQSFGNSEQLNYPVVPDGLNIRAVAALREAVRNQWLKSDDFADKVYWKNMHSIANEIIAAMLSTSPKQESE